MKWWTAQAARQREPLAMTKMTFGAAGIACAYLLLSTATRLSGVQTDWVWLALFLAVLTAAELWVLPIGLGLFARLAPDNRRATTIAAWFLAAFAGNLLSGGLGTLWSVLAPSAVFAAMAGVAAVSAIALLLLGRAVSRVEAKA